jgi:hypothetical protein
VAASPQAERKRRLISRKSAGDQIITKSTIAAVVSEQRYVSGEQQLLVGVDDATTQKLPMLFTSRTTASAFRCRRASGLGNNISTEAGQSLEIFDGVSARQRPATGGGRDGLVIPGGGDGAVALTVRGFQGIVSRITDL